MRHPHSSALLAAVAALALSAQPHAALPAANEQVARHVLSRITFGPRPGDVARLQRLGVARFVDEQLHPERLNDAEVPRRLESFETLRLDSRTIAQRYEIPALQARRARQQQTGDRPETQQTPQQMASNPERQRANLPLIELSQQKIIRAVYSERQLEEVLTDFWFNHFNVDARKGPARYMLTEYERDAIRPHVFGRFRDLLGATAKSPAMLFYLDNWMSTDPGGPRLNQAGPAARRLGSRMGLNENYGRELLELHTLGVDGGYTQKDVTEVARAFTGWTIQTPRLGGGFRFAPALHDDSEKMVLGRRLQAGGGERDGEAVLDLVSSHPATARFISMKLARRFVSDAPPIALVERMASSFIKSDGDLRVVMTVLLTSPEFLAPEAEHAKVKNPFEFLVSALRATGADVEDARPLVRTVQQLGMPLYQCQPPTGYKDSADTWVNTGALVNRMNVALLFADGKLPGVSVVAHPEPESLLAGEISEATRATIAKAQAPPQALALALGSPEFQRR